VRGLKQRCHTPPRLPPRFAPITGAWIETIEGRTEKTAQTFAPITGAWIETKRSQFALMSVFFAPITGAWIETIIRLW